MQTEATVLIPAELKGVHAKIQAWRQTRPGTRPMPEELWKEATAAARRLGVYRVVRALRVNSTGLKRRVMARGPVRGGGRGRTERVQRRQQPGGRPDFIEVSSLAGLGAPTETSASGDAVVEVVAPDGMRLTIRWKAAGQNVAALVNAFRGR
ncbi:MAG: hypothetical protein ACREU6_18335 [Steroidobacteraceae bacterium]